MLKCVSFLILQGIRKMKAKRERRHWELLNVKVHKWEKVRVGGIFTGWYMDKEVDVSKLSGKTHRNVGIPFCT